MSVAITTVLYAGDNIQLVNTMLHLLGRTAAKSNYCIVHLSSDDDLPAALAERQYHHFICEFPINQELVEQISIDFPLLKTTYLIPPVAAKAPKSSLAMEGLVSDEIKETLDYLSIPVYFKNREDQYIACNSYFSQLLGKTPAQVIGKTANEVFPEELSVEINKIDQKVFVDQQVYFYECSISDPAGRQRDVVFRKESVANGKIQIGLIFDVTEVNGARALLEKERTMLRATVDISSDLICFKDLQSRYTGCNKAFEQFIGYSEQEIVGKTYDQLFAPEQALISWAADRKAIANKSTYIGQEPHICHDGEEHIVEFKKVPLLDKQGDVQGLVMVGRDITTYHRIQKRLKIADTVFENSKECLLVTDGTAIIIAANKACCDACGYSKKELIGSPVSIFGGSQHENIEAALQQNKSWQGDMSYRTKSGVIHFAWAEVYIVEHAEKGIFSRISSFVDLNQNNNVEPKIQFLSKYDPLTGVFNRIALFNRLEAAISRAIYHQFNLAVILVNINDFKGINAHYGHHAGDAVLQEVATRLKSCVAEKDTVARFGGDEFVVIFDGVENELDAASVAQNIAAQFDRNFDIDDLSVQLSATIGIALSPDDGTDVDTLIGNAEKAMQRGRSYYNTAQSKAYLPSDTVQIKDSRHPANGTAYHFYTRKLTHHSRQQVKFEKQLKQALAQEQFELYYQPQYDLAKRQVVAVEGVLCWNHPQRGALHSDNFSSPAEHCGLAYSLALMTIRKAAIQAVTWQKAEINFGRISISLTEEQLSHLSLTADLQTILQETKCARQRLEFAVEEAIFKSERSVVYENLLNLSKMGIALCIDKFAEDRPLFRIFEQLAIDKFKLSKHVSEAPYADFVHRAVQDGMQVLARELGLSVVSDSLGNNTGGGPAVANRFSPSSQQMSNKAMKASEITFYLHCNKRK